MTAIANSTIMVIAIDGTSASGKGTLSRKVAKELDFAYLDTGLLYRAVAAKGLEKKAIHDEAAMAILARQFHWDWIHMPNLRSEEVSDAASVIAAYPAVRQALLAPQRDFAQNPPEGKKGAILDGRDIGTVVCPEADLKFFVTASPEIRAERRHRELQESGIAAIQGAVLANMQQRDRRDTTRLTAPLEMAEDAIVIDTTDLGPEQVLDQVMRHIKCLN